MAEDTSLLETVFDVAASMVCGGVAGYASYGLLDDFSFYMRTHSSAGSILPMTVLGIKAGATAFMAGGVLYTVKNNLDARKILFAAAALATVATHQWCHYRDCNRPEANAIAAASALAPN